MPEETRPAAGDAGFENRIREMAESVSALIRYHSIELPDGRVLPGLQSVEHLRQRLELFGLPQDLRGKRVLDIGAWDGWFSFECERRGARVTAVDCVELDTFLEAKRLLNSEVQYLTLDVDELSAKELGRFDIVLFFGVLYHLRHPLLGLEKVLELCTDLALIESYVIPAEARSIPAVMEFYERTELGGQLDNWCGPSPECLIGMCRSAGFADARLLEIVNQRASVICHRKWRDSRAHSAIPAPHLHSSVNNRSHVAVFHPRKDEYVCSYFRHPAGELTIGDVRIALDEYGVPALAVHSNGPGAWQVNCLRPPGLDLGRHYVRLSVLGSAFSNPVEIVLAEGSAAKLPGRPESASRELAEVCSAEYHPSNDIRMAVNRGGSLIVYIRSSAVVLGASDVEIRAGDRNFAADVVSSLGDGVWQITVYLREPLEMLPPIQALVTGTSTERD